MDSKTDQLSPSLKLTITVFASESLFKASIYMKSHSPKTRNKSQFYYLVDDYSCYTYLISVFTNFLILSVHSF